MSFQIINRFERREGAVDTYRGAELQISKDTSMVRVNGIIGARNRVNRENTKFFNSTRRAIWISESVFNPAALPRCMREVYNTLIPHYNQVIEQGQSCLGAVAATLIAVSNPGPRSLIPGMDTLTFTDNVTKHGYSYFHDQFVRVMTSFFGQTTQEVLVILGSGDPLLQYIHKYIQQAEINVPQSNQFAIQFDSFKLPVFEVNEELLHLELDQSQIAPTYQKFFREPLNLTRLPARIIVVVQNSQHIFFPTKYLASR